MIFVKDKESSNFSCKSKKKIVWGLDVPAQKQNKNNSNIEKDKKLIEEPILMKNYRVTESVRNDDERFAMDLNSRPNEPTRESYAAVPVSEFGAAMLRGMGWKEKEEKLLSNDGPVPGPVPIKYVTRPERLGLGASEVKDISELKTRKPIEQSLGIEMTEEEERIMQKHNKGSARKKPIDNKPFFELSAKHKNYIGIDEIASKKMKLEVGIGDKVIIINGEHCDLKGIIKGDNLDIKSKNRNTNSYQTATESSNFWIVELQISGAFVNVPKSAVKIYDSSNGSCSNFMKNDDNFVKNNVNGSIWTCPGLIVKIKSKNSFMNGRYYLRKGIILDVHEDRTCIIKLFSASTENNKLQPTILSKVPQMVLETCLPKYLDLTRPTVKYLRKEKGLENFQAPFKILEFNADKKVAVVQADNDVELVFEADFDDICEFVDDN